MKGGALVIAGPTGAGKSALAMALADKFSAEIISCDSVQVYRGFDLGSAKPTAAEQAAVRHHLIDCVAWNIPYDANLFGEAARAVVSDAESRGVLPLVAGGTGLYLRAFLEMNWSKDLPTSEGLRHRLRTRTSKDLWQFLWRLDRQRAAAVHPHDHYRCMRALEVVLLTGKTFEAATGATKVTATFKGLKVLLAPPREVLDQNIRLRTSKMLANGLIDEVKGLLSLGVLGTCKPMQSIGYKQVVQYLDGQFPLSDLQDRIVMATRQFAKRQMTWFRNMDFDLTIGEPKMDANLTEMVGRTWDLKP